MNSSAYKVSAMVQGILYLVLGGLVFFANIEHIPLPALSVEFLLCCLMATVVMSSLGVVSAVQEATAAFREASQLKVDKRQ